MITPGTILLALAGGLLPALLWLLFWLREDRLHPEPKRVIVISFLLGMLAVIVALPLEYMTLRLLAGSGTVLIFWAVWEEILKGAAAYMGGIRSREFDEPIDPIIYLITAALGFAALENTFFLIDPLINGSNVLSVLTGNIRFIGATLLHVISSGAIGVSIALSFYGSTKKKIIYQTIGVLVAIVIHTLFNYFILDAEASTMVMVFSFVWLAVILLLLIFERVKRLRRPPLQSTKALSE